MYFTCFPWWYYMFWIIPCYLWFHITWIIYHHHHLILIMYSIDVVNSSLISSIIFILHIAYSVMYSALIRLRCVLYVCITLILSPMWRSCHVKGIICFMMNRQMKIRYRPYKYIYRFPYPMKSALCKCRSYI